MRRHGSPCTLRARRFPLPEEFFPSSWALLSCPSGPVAVRACDPGAPFLDAFSDAWCFIVRSHRVTTVHNAYMRRHARSETGQEDDGESLLMNATKRQSHTYTESGVRIQTEKTPIFRLALLLDRNPGRWQPTCTNPLPR